MQIQTLCILHRLKGKPESGPLSGPESPIRADQAWHLETCMRELYLYDFDLGVVPPGWTVTRGERAYEFFLRLAGGLESAILGETEIFGQIKAAWKKCETETPLLAARYQDVFQKLFEDAKELRSRFFQNIGSSSYGSLARRMIPEIGGEGPILVIGAGKLARAIFPYFTDRKLVVWNRTRENIPSHLSGIDSESELLQAWKSCQHAIICIPSDADREAAWLKEWDQGRSEGVAKGQILHFGDDRAHERMITLPQIFDLDRSQNEIRRQMAKKAEAFCTERTRLRSLGPSITTAHGWEDLVMFHAY